mmetsp:Transcript_152116/g.264444  ORF Transcript_152116/g.264444 Transcript_152116/m.264444 type:complete len:281 (+) Transcript_152116:70-912(+)
MANWILQAKIKQNPQSGSAGFACKSSASALFAVLVARGAATAGTAEAVLVPSAGAMLVPGAAALPELPITNAPLLLLLVLAMPSDWPRAAVAARAAASWETGSECRRTVGNSPDESRASVCLLVSAGGPAEGTAANATSAPVVAEAGTAATLATAAGPLKSPVLLALLDKAPELEAPTTPSAAAECRRTVGRFSSSSSTRSLCRRTAAGGAALADDVDDTSAPAIGAAAAAAGDGAVLGPGGSRGGVAVCRTIVSVFRRTVGNASGWSAMSVCRRTLSRC